MREPIWISEADVAQVLDMRGAIHALTRGLHLEASSDAHNMVKTHVEWGSSTLHAIGAVFPSTGICGTKTWAHTSEGATPLLVMFDCKDGSIKAIIEAFALGQLRTAAATGVATKWLAAQDADTLAMIGTGKQALAQIAAVAAVRHIKKVIVFGRNAERRDEFILRVRENLAAEIVAASSVEEALEAATIINVATRATEPIVTASMVRQGAHINSVGAIVPARAEIAQDVLKRVSQFAADSVPQAQKLSRELREYFGSDPEAWREIRSLADIVASSETRKADGDVTLFKALGVGISDLSLGVEILEKALSRGLGRNFPAPQRVKPRLFENA